MKRKRRILLHSMILTFLLTLLVGSMVVHAEGEVTTVEINHSSYTVNIGDDSKLQLAVSNLDTTKKKPRWVSYNANVASVDQDGVVTPIRKGKTIISSGIGFPRKTCTITVVEPSVKLNKTAVTLYCPGDTESGSDNTAPTTPGSTITLKPTVKGANKATAAEWSSSDETVATVGEKDAQGKVVVTALKEGDAVITARVNGKTASCRVTVLKSAISLNVDTMQLSNKGVGSSIKLVPTVVGGNKKITWTSADQTIAKVSGGKVTGKAEGTTTITATANGVSAQCAVTVKPGQISINEEKVQLYVTEKPEGVTSTPGDRKDLKTNAATTDSVVWTSSDETVATVANIKPNGSTARVIAASAGTATITATCTDRNGNESKDTCVIDVKDTATSITETIVHVRTKGTDKTYTLGYQVIGFKNTVTWRSSNTRVASVSKGKITGKKAGEAIVTMKANGVEDTVKVVVQDFQPTITLNQKEYVLYTTGQGKTVTLKAKIDGKSKAVEWKSDNEKIATVSRGKVTANKEGRALITATANGVTAKCWITVKDPKILFAKNAFTLNERETLNLRDDDTFVEIIGVNQNVTYKSDNTKAATVNGKGVVTAKKAGRATITAKSKANGAEYKCYVIVQTGCTEHKWGEWNDIQWEDNMKLENLTQEATCVESGRKTRECSECHGLDQEVTPPTGHSWGAWLTIARATESETGLKIQKCQNTGCEEENREIIPVKQKGELADGYRLVWEDEFNGTELNRNDWNVETHAPGWVNAEWQEYVDKPENIYVKDGNLVIQAIQTGEGDDAAYTSGRINTQNKHDYQYGRFEARAKVPSGKGFLPAFWMMPTDESYYGQWPKCGEIDVMEVMGHETDKAYSTLHFGEPHTQKQGTYTLPAGAADFAEDFHEYACEWDPGEFRFYVDGQLFYRETDWFSKKEGFGERAYPAPYDQPFYMILNLAVGGSWVGNPDDTTQFGDNAQLVVDYVRVYEKDSYDHDIEKPVTDVKLRDPDADGNYIINGDFSTEEDLSADDANWRLLLAAGGNATAKITDQKLHIETETAGEQNHSVQIVQANLPIEEGKKYKLSFDAYADEARTIITNVTAPDLNYVRYLADQTVDLTTESQKFAYTFEMTSSNDANGRVEFNLGNQGSTATVHIDNVRLEQIGDAAEVVKGVLPDGNYVYNGSFDEGNEPGKVRLVYWDWDTAQCADANVSVTPDSKRELKVVVPDTVTALDQVVVSQTPIAITGGQDYVLSFNAHADQAKTIKTTIAGQEFASSLTTDNAEYKYKFTTATDLNGSELRFLLGAAGTTYIDNVSIKGDGLIVNGDFSSGMVGYEVYVNDAAKATYIVGKQSGEETSDVFSMDIDNTGADGWFIQLKQNNVQLEKDKWYKLSLDAKSTKDRSIVYKLQRDGSKHKTEDGKEDWRPYSGDAPIALTSTWQTYEQTFKMTEDTDPETILSIELGGVGGTQITDKHTVRIDNIRLEETEAQEEPTVPVGTELIKNGDFSEGKENWEGGIMKGEGADGTESYDGKAVYNITKVGTKDWHVHLKQSGLTLEKGAKYKVTFKIKSTAARLVSYSFMNKSYDGYGGENLDLKANEERAVDYTFTVDKVTDSDICFQISMGQMVDYANDEAPIPTATSTIEIDDISVVKLGGGTGEEPEGPDDPIAYGTDLIKNGDFATGESSWSKHIDANSGAGAKTDFTKGYARYEITKVGTVDWHVQLKQTGLAMEKGEKYKVNLKIGSSIDRNVRVVFLNGSNEEVVEGGIPISLKKDKMQSVSKIVELNDAYESGTVAFQLSMGKIGDGELDAHAIEIDDISVTKVQADAAADTEKEEEHEITPPSEGGDDPIEEGENLIKNGGFTSSANWSSYFHKDDGADGDAKFEGGKARYEITNAGTADWNVQLKQEGLAMEKGATYKVNLKIASTIDRDVKVAFMGKVTKEGKEADEWYGGSDLTLKAGKQISFSKIVTLKDIEIENETLAFQLSMGQLGNETLAAHAIEIDDISVTKVAAGATSDEETEEDVTITPPSESGGEPDPTDEDNLIKNGDFSTGETNWSHDITSPAEATVTFGEKKVTYNISNVGSNDWEVQLKQSGLKLEKDATYKISFKIQSSKARTVKYVFQNPTGYVWYGGEDISLTADTQKVVDKEFTVTEENCETIDFQISMGKITDVDTPASTIEISDIKLVKVVDGTTTDPETPEEGKDTPDTPPAVDDDGSGSAVEARSDRTGGNSEDASNDTEDTEETDPAQQETPETQNDSAGGEESVDPSGIDQEEISEE